MSNDTIVEDFQRCVAFCSKSIENWGRSKKENYEEKIRKAKAEYQRAIDTNKGVGAASRMLENVMVEEEIYWKQRV